MKMFIYTENGIRSFKNLDSSKTGLYEGEGSIVYDVFVFCIKEAMNRFICDMLKNIPKLLENY